MTGDPPDSFRHGVRQTSPRRISSSVGDPAPAIDKSASPSHNLNHGLGEEKVSSGNASTVERRAPGRLSGEGPLSIHEVAERAKVSIATVSRTINGVPTVTPELSRRVWKAIEEVGYYPNTHARSLVSGRSRIFGLIVSEITNPFFPEIIQGFEDVAVHHNY